MANHVRQQIREAAATALLGLTTTGSRVFQNRLYTVDASTELPCLLIKTDSESIAAGTIHGVLDRTMKLTIEGLAAAADNVDDALDTIVKETETRIAQDPRFGNLAISTVLDTIEIDIEAEGERPVGRAIMQFNVNYFTNAGAPDVSL